MTALKNPELVEPRTVCDNPSNTCSIILKGKDAEDVGHFSYPGSVVSKDGHADQDIPTSVGDCCFTYRP